MNDTDPETTNVAIVASALAALAEGDVAALANLLHPDARWHVAPAGTLKGLYRGRDQILGFFAHARDETEGTMRLTPVAVAAAGERVFALTVARAVRGGRYREWEAVLVFTLSNGTTTDIHHHLVDYPGFARFWE